MDQFDCVGTDISLHILALHIMVLDFFNVSREPGKIKKKVNRWNKGFLALKNLRSFTKISEALFFLI